MTEAQTLVRHAAATLHSLASAVRRKAQTSGARLERVRALITWVSAATILLLCWPIETVTPQIGLDPSWVAALHVAAQRHMHFGSELAYTYGPLGFIGLPQPYFGWTSAIAFAFALGLDLMVCVVIVHLLRRAFPFWLALPLAYVIARPLGWMEQWNLVGLLAFVACVELLRRYGARNIPYWALVGLGLMAGLSLLGKINVGITVALVAGVLAFFASIQRRPAILIFGASGAAAFVGSWLVLGQNPWDIPQYVRYSIDIAVGYNQAMGMDFGPSMAWIYLLGLVVIATVAVAANEASDGWPRLERLVLLVIGLGVAFAFFKTGFVRDRFGTFFATGLAFLPVFAVRVRRARMTLSVATLAVCVMIVSSGDLASYLDPRPNIQWAREQVSTIVRHPSEAAASTAAQMRDLYALPPQALEAIGDHTVHVQPFDAGVAYAYPDLKWDPLPIFQPYDAYTDLLDEADAASLTSPTAPQRILWLTPPGQPLTIDGRSVYLEAPRTLITMLCRYVPVVSTPSWQVWTAVPDRCGTPELLSSVTARAGQQIDVPQESRPGRLVVVHIRGVASSLGERVQGLILKTPAWWLESGQTHRLVPSTADGPLLVGATGPSDYANALWLGPPVTTISVGTQVNGGNPMSESSDILTYDFYSIPIQRALP